MNPKYTTAGLAFGLLVALALDTALAQNPKPQVRQKASTRGASPAPDHRQQPRRPADWCLAGYGRRQALSGTRPAGRTRRTTRPAAALRNAKAQTGCRGSGRSGLCPATKCIHRAGPAGGFKWYEHRDPISARDDTGDGACASQHAAGNAVAVNTVTVNGAFPFGTAAHGQTGPGIRPETAAGNTPTISGRPEKAS